MSNISAEDGDWAAQSLPQDDVFLPLTGAPLPLEMFEAPKHSGAPELAEDGDDNGNGNDDGNDDDIAAEVMEISGMDAPVANVEREQAERELALLEAEMRQTQTALPAAVASAPRSIDEAEDISRAYDEAFSSSVRLVRQTFVDETKKAFLDGGEAQSRAYEVAFVVPALLELANAKHDIDFGNTLPVPESVLAMWLATWLKTNDARLERLLRENASWSAFTRHTSDERDLARIRPLVGLDQQGTPVQPDVWAAARTRKPFFMHRFRTAVKAAAKEAVLEYRRSIVRNETIYGAAVRASLQNGGQPDLFVLTLPFQNRAARIRNISQGIPRVTQDAISALIDSVYVATNIAGGGDSNDFNLALPIPDYVEDDVDVDGDDNDGNDGYSGAARGLQSNIDFVTGNSMSRRLLQITDQISDAVTAERLRIRQQELKAKIGALAKTLRGPLTLNRKNTSGQAFTLNIMVHKVPRDQPATLTWRLRTWIGTVRDLKNETLTAGAINRPAKITIVPAAACGTVPGERYSGELMAGWYWAEVSVPGKSPVKSAMATLHIWAVCARDGETYELGVPRTFGECKWRGGASSHRRRIEVREKRKLTGQDVNSMQLQDAETGEHAGPVDLADDVAVLNAAYANSETAQVAMYGYLATLRRIEGRLPPGELFASIVQNLSDTTKQFPSEVRAALAAGRAKTAAARTLRQIPVLTVLYALATDQLRVHLRGAERAFFLDQLPMRISGPFTMAWRHCCATETYMSTRIWALLGAQADAYLGSVGEREALERAAAQEAVAQMTYDDMLVSRVWTDPLLASQYDDGRKREHFFADYESMTRLHDRAAQLRLHGGANVNNEITTWTGEHNFRSQYPDWYEVDFAANPFTGLPECVLVQRGSERALPGAWSGRFHDDIEKLRVAYNAFPQPDLGAPPSRQLQVRLQRNKLQKEIEDAVADFNARMARA